MKNYLLLTLALLFSASLYAQTDIVLTASTKTTIEATPQQIIDSLHKKFPNAQAIQSYQTPPEGVKKGWAVSKDDYEPETGAPVSQYTISFKDDNYQYFALFNPDGTLIRSKFQQDEATLPEAAKAELQKLGGSNYKSYTIVTKTYYREVNNTTHKEYYEVLAVSKSNPNVKKKITLDQDGKVVKVSSK